MLAEIGWHGPLVNTTWLRSFEQIYLLLTLALWLLSL